MTVEKSPSTTPGDASSTTPLPEALARHLGHDPVLQWLIRAGHPLTVENYVDLAWWGDLPAELEPDQQELLDALAEYEASNAVADASDRTPATTRSGRPTASALSSLPKGHDQRAGGACKAPSLASPLYRSQSPMTARNG